MCPSQHGAMGACSIVAAAAAVGSRGSLRGERLAEYVTTRVAASIAPAHGGREKVDDVVRDDVKASDDLGWYDMLETERSIMVRLSEEIWSELVEDTILSGVNN